jgi:hypothetical protein
MEKAFVHAVYGFIIQTGESMWSWMDGKSKSRRRKFHSIVGAVDWKGSGWLTKYIFVFDVERLIYIEPKGGR